MTSTGEQEAGRRWIASVVVLLVVTLFHPALSSAQGWVNWWNGANNTMYWMYNGNWRLAYTYGAGQWYDCTQLGGHDNWSTLGSAGQSPDFLGNAAIGSYLPVGNGWRYGYDTRSDTGYWMNSAGNFRFGYQYGSGQWWDQNFGQWNQIGASGVQSPFVGDGSLHDMKNAWSYEYLVSNDTGYWATGGNFRLAYGYTGGVWFDNSDTWRALSSTGVGSAFIGNAAIGAYYYMNNNWYYGYNVDQNIGYWKASTGPFRFGYYYPGAIWYDQADTGGWATLGSAGLSSAFMGDGSVHNLQYGWSYYYVLSQDTGYWYDGSGGDWRFRLTYNFGQWWDHDTTGWRSLAQGISAAFIGDGNPHVLPGNWSYTFGSGVATWTNTSPGAQFMYNYGSPQWSYHDSGGWHVATYSPVTTTVTNSYGTGITLRVLFGYGNAALYGISPGFSNFTQSTDPSIYLCHLAPGQTTTFTYINPNPTRNLITPQPGDALNFVADGLTFNDAAQTRFEYNFNCSVNGGINWSNEANLSLVNGYNGGMDLMTGLGEHIYAYTAFGNSTHLGVYGLGCDLGKAIYRPPFNYYDYQGNRVLDLHDPNIPWEVYDNFGGSANFFTLTILPTYGFPYTWVHNNWAQYKPAPGTIQPLDEVFGIKWLAESR
jgi:hypothetical protein